MISIIRLSLLSVLLATPALAHDHASVHGMLVVGRSQIYLSHLPMFDSPHDYQVIAAADLTPEARATYLADLAAHPGQKLYTLVPEPFVLPDMMAHPRPFGADLYRGHFERGGTPIAQGITVRISQVIYLKRFDPAATHPAQARYLAFGAPGGEQFLAHVITAKPDFDQVFATQGLAGPLPRVVGFAAQSDETPLSEAPDRRELYLETGDLSD